MDIDQIIEKLEALTEQYEESAPKETVQKFSGTVELYTLETDMAFIQGLERARELLEELRDTHAE